MGFSEAMIPMVFFVISIVGIASTSITVKTYLDTKKEKDSNFNFSAFILAVSIIGLLASGYFSYKAFKGGAAGAAGANNAKVANAGATAPSEMAGSQTNLGSQEMGLANKLENIAASSASRAAKAAEGAKLANALGATLGQLKKAN